MKTRKATFSMRKGATAPENVFIDEETGLILFREPCRKKFKVGWTLSRKAIRYQVMAISRVLSNNTLPDDWAVFVRVVSPE
jgi:hypothetical protein